VKHNAKEIFKQYLTKRGLKITQQRHIILEAFVDLDRHLHVDEFYPLLRARHPHIGHATVYRTLKLFAESGIAREIHFGDGVTRYENATLGGHHDHLICTSCGTVTEFENRAIGQLQEEIAQIHGFQIESLKIELRGVCRQCLTQNRKRLNQ
jgi:Fur family transcriptional regulator, ferric uptake regulator